MGSKKSSNAAENVDESEPVLPQRNPSHIRNKFKRAEVMQKYRKQKKTYKKALKLKRNNEQLHEFGKCLPLQPKTVDNSREPNITLVSTSDDNVNQEIYGDEIDDEFASIFNNTCAPKLMISTPQYPSADLYQFVHDLMQLLPNSFYYKRKHFTIKEITQFASNKEFTHLILLSEKHKVCNGMYVSRLPIGPTAFFKVTNVKLHSDITGSARRTNHQPELILNNFSTRLGRRIGRLLGSCFEHKADFIGRQVVTFHNQRDYIFVRHHRYIFDDNGKKARLQEIGPRFTLKLRWLQEGTFDTKLGEYEWMSRPHRQGASRKRFFL